jgi:protein-tyrosine phosphatase
VFWDVHSHVVPSGDDGVGSVEEGLELCAEAARRGTSVLFATPHVGPVHPLPPERERSLRSAHAEMAPAAAVFGLDLRLGFELTPAEELLDDDLGRYTLGDLPAALMELPFRGSLELSERVAEAIETAGLTPVIAHPERAAALHEDAERARGYAERGWLLQVNATSLTGRHGPESERVGWWLVEEGLASLVGSDGHRRTRPPFLDEAYALACDRAGRATADALFGGGALPLARRDGADVAKRR